MPKILKNKEGFTLIELLVATAVSSIILLMVYSAYNSIVHSVEQGKLYSSYYENLNLALRKIERDITNIYWKKDRKELAVTGKIESGSSTLSFVTASSHYTRVIVSPYRQYPKTDLVRVYYKLEKDISGKGMNLIRNESVFINDKDEIPDKKETIIGNVEKIHFSFNQRSDWTDKWDSAEVNKIPGYIKTELSVIRPGRDTEKFSFISEIHIRNE